MSEPRGRAAGSVGAAEADHTRPGPMLARLARELPVGGYLYEPKWDGFRCLAYGDGRGVDLRSRHGRPFSRYFPEIVAALQGLREQDFALDGELLVLRDGRFDFEALLARLHPAASRVERLRLETPASFVTFDLLSVSGRSLVGNGFGERRRELEALLADAQPPLYLTPSTADPAEAGQWLSRFSGGGVDGVVAKHVDLSYQPGKRAMVKVKHEHTVDCVVAGFRLLVDRPLPSSLLLGLYEHGTLKHVGIVSALSERLRREALERLLPLVVGLDGHPWEQGFLLAGGATGRLRGAAGRWAPGEMAQDWVPVAPVLVAEVAYGQIDGHRFRHPARLRRWRPDRDPRSCHADQLAHAATNAADLLAAP